jgi:hypothetical protein
MKKLIYSFIILTAALISTESFSESVNLFNQPMQNDNSCGIRQTLIAAHVLKHENSGSFTGNIINTWNFYNEIFHRDFNEYLGKESCNLPSLFTNNVPKNETAPARARVNGGPMTLPSGLVQTAQGQQGLKAVKIYLYKPLLDAFFGSFYVTEEISLLDNEIELFKDLGVEIVTLQSKLSRDNFPSPTNARNKYFQLLINDGQHWIGTTNTTTYDSLTNGPVNFDAKKVFDAFAGIMIEYEYQNAETQDGVVVR